MGMGGKWPEVIVAVGERMICIGPTSRIIARTNRYGIAIQLKVIQGGGFSGRKFLFPIIQVFLFCSSLAVDNSLRHALGGCRGFFAFSILPLRCLLVLLLNILIDNGA